MSTISAGTTSTNALVNTGDTTGNLVFQTNGTTTAMTIDTSQRVGIGTSSPTQKLDVTGVIKCSSGNLIGSDENYFYQSASNTLTLRVGTSADTSYLNFKGVSGTPVLDGPGGVLGFATTGSERARIDSSGNLLVGTTSASGAKLNVNGDVQQRGTNGRITQAVKGIGSAVSSITVDVGGGLDATSYFVEISLSGYTGVYLRYIHTVYKANSWTDYSPNVVQNLASSGVSVAYSSPSAGVLRYTITASTIYPVVQVKVTSGGTTADPATTISIS